jgi:hypothetical protein
LAVLLTVAVLLLAAAPAGAQTPGSAAAAPSSTVLTTPVYNDRPPSGLRRSARDMLALAARQPKIRAVRAERPGSYGRAYIKGKDRWQVGFYLSRPGDDEEIGQVLIDDRSGKVLESWTGPQVAWTMARGYPGAFGRKANAPYVWLGLLVLFVLPFVRRPWRMLHLDVLVLASLSLSYWAFNAANIHLSVPLAYPPLAYLLVRVLMVARARARPHHEAAAPPPRLLLGTDLLAFAVVFLLGFRLGLNITNSNVIDVGYAGVIGADHLAAGEPLYGHFPGDNEHGDTYGPANYLAYVPFEQILPWKGTWNDLPAAHAAAVAFDLLCVAGMWLLGRRVRDGSLGLLLAYLWLAFPFTLMVSNSNSNDALVGALVIACLLLAGRPIGRGAALATAALTKFAPLGIGPLLATYPTDGGGTVSPRGVLRTAAGFVLAAVALLVPVVLIEGGLSGFLDQTLAFQFDRESPFSIWGLWNLGTVQHVVQGGAVLLAIAVAVFPRRRDLLTLAALAAAVLIAVQLAVTHWFYLYVVWFLPPLLLALVGGQFAPRPATPGAEPARSTLPAAAPARSG